MPVYEYGCNECSHEFEEYNTMAEYDAPLSEPCPSCYKVGFIDRLISGAEICDPVSVGVRKVLEVAQKARMNKLNVVVGLQRHYKKNISIYIIKSKTVKLEKSLVVKYIGIVEVYG